MPLRILWSLLWRSVLMFPFGLVFGLLFAFVVVGAPIVIVALPVYAAVFLWCGEWLLGAACLAGVVPAVLARKWLGRFVIEYPPTML